MRMSMLVIITPHLLVVIIYKLKKTYDFMMVAADLLLSMICAGFIINTTNVL